MFVKNQKKIGKFHFIGQKKIENQPLSKFLPHIRQNQRNILINQILTNILNTWGPVEDKKCKISPFQSIYLFLGMILVILVPLAKTILHTPMK